MTTKNYLTLNVSNPKTMTTRLRCKQVLEGTMFVGVLGSEISGCL